MVRKASSTTASGTARLALLLSDEPLTFAASPLVEDFPLELDDVGFRAESWRTSSRTRRRRAGNVVTSPERRSVRAWFWMMVGQLDEWELRAWRRAS